MKWSPNQQDLNPKSLNGVELEVLRALVSLDLSIRLLGLPELLVGNKMLSNRVADWADRLGDREGQALLAALNGEGARRVLALGVLDIREEIVGGLDVGGAVNGGLPGLHGSGLDHLELIATETILGLVLMKSRRDSTDLQKVL